MLYKLKEILVKALMDMQLKKCYVCKKADGVIYQARYLGPPRNLKGPPGPWKQRFYHQACYNLESMDKTIYIDLRLRSAELHEERYLAGESWNTQVVK